MTEDSGAKHAANSPVAHSVLLILTARLSTVNESNFKTIHVRSTLTSSYHNEICM